MAGKIYVARYSAVLDGPDGGQVTVTGGVTRVREGHPLLRGRESMFDEVSVHYDIEDARSAPQDEPEPEPVVSAPAKAAPATAEDDDYFPPPAKKTAAPRRGPRKQA